VNVEEREMDSGIVSDILSRRKKRRKQGLLSTTTAKQRLQTSSEAVKSLALKSAVSFTRANDVEEAKPDGDFAMKLGVQGSSVLQSQGREQFGSTAWDPEMASDDEELYPERDESGLSDGLTTEEDWLFTSIARDTAAIEHMLRVKKLEIVTQDAEIAAAPEKLKAAKELILTWDNKANFYFKMREYFQNITMRLGRKLKMIEDIYQVRESMWKEEAEAALASQDTVQDTSSIENRKKALSGASKLILADDEPTDFPTMDYVIGLFTEWQKKYEKDFVDTYAQDSLVGMLVPFVMVDLFEWNPMGSVPFVFENRVWFKKCCWNEKVLPKLIAKTVFIRILRHADFIEQGGIVSTSSYGSWAINYTKNVQAALLFAERYCGKGGGENSAGSRVISEADREKLDRLRTCIA
jgi:hypothetical protein